MIVDIVDMVIMMIIIPLVIFVSIEVLFVGVDQFIPALLSVMIAAHARRDAATTQRYAYAVAAL